MAHGPIPSYEMVCKLVGQLYLESRLSLEQQADLHKQETDELRRQLARVETERDQALQQFVSRENGAS